MHWLTLQLLWESQQIDVLRHLHQCSMYLPTHYYRSSDGFINTGSVVFGLYPSNDNNGHTAIQNEIMAATGISSIFDLPGISNITARGWSGGTNNDYLTTGNYLTSGQVPVTLSILRIEGFTFVHLGLIEITTIRSRILYSACTRN